jgi:lysophospholipase L1-like esterase
MSDFILREATTTSCTTDSTLCIYPEECIAAGWYYYHNSCKSTAPTVTDDYYVAMGDSITLASFHDDISSDGVGYQPILANSLTYYEGYPVTVINSGKSGETSAQGLARLLDLIDTHSQAKWFLIQYGTNDAFIPLNSGLGLQVGDTGYSGSYKHNMQQMIDLITSAGMRVAFPKLPKAFAPREYLNTYIQVYNQVIDELITENSLTINPPDFYYYFENHPDEMDDDLHPDGIGYTSMALLWFNSIGYPMSITSNFGVIYASGIFNIN